MEFSMMFNERTINLQEQMLFTYKSAKEELK